MPFLNFEIHLFIKTKLLHLSQKPDHLFAYLLSWSKISKIKLVSYPVAALHYLNHIFNCCRFCMALLFYFHGIAISICVTAELTLATAEHNLRVLNTWNGNREKEVRKRHIYHPCFLDDCNEAQRYLLKVI